MTDDHVQRVLDLLGDSVKTTGPDQWQAQCPAHEDRVASLSLGIGADRQALLNCFAGCKTEAIVNKLNLTMADLFPKNTSPNCQKRERRTSQRAAHQTFEMAVAAAERQTQGKHAGTWTYDRADGAEHFRVVRFELSDGKTFRPFHHTDRGWVQTDPPGQLSLYRLPELLDADTDEVIYGFEGERCVDAARTLGLTATTSAHGCKSPKKSDWTVLAGKRVLWLPDADAGGRKYAQTVAGILSSLDPPASVKIVELPGLEDHGDIVDFIEDRGIDAKDDAAIRLEIEALAEQAGEWKPLTEVNASAADELRDGFHPADGKDKGQCIGLTRQLAEAVLRDDHFAQDVGGALYHFTGGVYRPQGEQRVKRRVKIVLAKWDLSTKWSTHRASEVVAYIAVDTPALWERPPLDTVNVLNGLLNVNTRELRPHDPAFLSPIQLPVKYDPDAICPAWDQFIQETFPEDARAVAFEIPAELMTPDTSKQKAVLALGEGANGKGVYLGAIIAFIGRRNIAAVSLHRFESDKFASARLVGKLANICSDLPSEHLAGTSMFKGIVGADVMLAERKFAQSFEFVPFARLIFSANHPPRSTDASHAFFRRWLVIPFPRTFEPDEQTPRDELDAKLADPAELSGVLNKALGALPRLRGEGFTEAPSMREAWDEFRQTTDPLTVWLERSTVQISDAIVPKDDLRKAYKFHANDEGFPTITAHAMTKAIKRFYPDVAEDQRTVRGRVVWCWIGIGWAAKEQ